MNPCETTPNHQLILLLTKTLEKHRDALLKIIAVKENMHYDTLRDVVSARVRYDASVGGGSRHGDTTDSPEPAAEAPGR